MRRWLALVVLVACAAWAVPDRARDRLWGRFYGRALAVAQSLYAFFEFAPATGAGMSTACAGVAVTGAKGEPVTVTGGSTAYCSKAIGTAPMWYAPGDLVSIGAGLPLVMPGHDGTTINGVLADPTRTNTVTRSTNLTNVAWTLAGPPNPTRVDSDGGAEFLAPDGTNTASLIEFGATTTTADSAIYQAGGCGTSGAASASFYAKSWDGGAMPLDLLINKGGTFACTTCNVPGIDAGVNPWVRCEDENAAITSIGNFSFGNQGSCSSATRPAKKVYIWNPGCELGSYSTLLPATAGASVTRTARTYSIAQTLPPGGFSVAATWVSRGVADSTGGTIFALDTGLENSLEAQWVSSTVGCALRINGARTYLAAPGAPVAKASNRVACAFDGTTLTSCLAGSCATGIDAGTPWSGAATLWIGSAADGGAQPGGTVKMECNDAPSRCR